MTSRHRGTSSRNGICIYGPEEGTIGGGGRNGRADEGELTRSDGLLLFVGPGFIPPSRLAQGLVAGADGHDGQQGEDQRCGAAHVPLAEDNAEVGRVPGEEHLFTGVRSGPRPTMISWLVHYYYYCY